MSDTPQQSRPGDDAQRIAAIREKAAYSIAQGYETAHCLTAAETMWLLGQLAASRAAAEREAAARAELEKTVRELRLTTSDALELSRLALSILQNEYSDDDGEWPHPGLRDAEKYFSGLIAALSHPAASKGDAPPVRRSQSKFPDSVDCTEQMDEAPPSAIQAAIDGPTSAPETRAKPAGRASPPSLQAQAGRKGKAVSDELTEADCDVLDRAALSALPDWKTVNFRLGLVRRLRAELRRLRREVDELKRRAVVTTGPGEPERVQIKLPEIGK